MLLSVVGILIVMSEGSIKTLQEIRFNRGDLMMLVGTLFFAWYNVGCRSILTKYPPLFTAFFFTVVTAAFSFPFFLQEVASVRWEAPSIWIAGVYTGLFPSALGLYIQQLGIQRIGVSRAVGFNNLIPVFSVVISLFVFGIDGVKPTHLSAWRSSFHAFSGTLESSKTTPATAPHPVTSVNDPHRRRGREKGKRPPAGTDKSLRFRNRSPSWRDRPSPRPDQRERYDPDETLFS